MKKNTYAYGSKEFDKQLKIEEEQSVRLKIFYTALIAMIFFIILYFLAANVNAQTTLASNEKIFTVERRLTLVEDETLRTTSFDKTSLGTSFNELSFRDRFWKRCLEEFDERMCQWGEAQIMHEGTFNAYRYAEYASEQHCSWGMWQNYICDDYGWTILEARYVYTVLTTKSPIAEYERLKKFEYLLDENWQINELLRRYKTRIARQGFSDKWCTNKIILGEKMHQNLYCAVRLHNWNAGDQYVTKIAKMRQKLFFNN